MPSRSKASRAPRPIARPRPRSAARPAPKRPAPKSPPRAAPKAAAKRPSAKPASKSSGGSSKNLPAPSPPALPLLVDRSHILSLAFLRDGDEFLARLETDSGQITELKNRSLDQLLSLVANELEDLLE